MPYREGDSAAQWDRAFANACELLLEAVDASNEREVERARRIVADIDPVEHAASRAGTPSDRVREMISVRRAVMDKLHTTLTRSHAWRQVRATGRRVDEALERARALETKDVDRDRAKETERGIELSTISLVIEGKEVATARAVLHDTFVDPDRRRAAGRPPLPPDVVERSIGIVERALSQADDLLARARMNRTPEAVAADAALWLVWDDLVHRVREMAIELERAGHWNVKS